MHEQHKPTRHFCSSLIYAFLLESPCSATHYSSLISLKPPSTISHHTFLPSTSVNPQKLLLEPFKCSKELFICLFIQLFIPSSTHPSIHSLHQLNAHTNPSTHPFIYSPKPPSIYLFIHSFIYPIFHPSIRSSNHLQLFFHKLQWCVHRARIITWAR